MIEERVLQDLDYFKVIALIEDLSNSEATKECIRKIYPFENFEQSKRALKEFSEIKEFFDKGGDIPISSFPDIFPLLQKAKIEGVFFESVELTSLLKVLRVLDRISPLIDDLLNFQSLSKKIREILGNHTSVCQPYLLERLENTVDEDGNILDTASPMLKYTRKLIKNTEERIKNKLEEFINRQDIKIFLQDNFITKRNNRWVIPVRMDSKGQIKGIIHDVSRSGETAFIEPEETSTLSKQLEELLVEERLEEIRILKEISLEIHQISDSLEREFQLLVYLDKMKAIYKYSQKFNAHIPQITEERYIRLINAKHPILMLSTKEVVPLDLELMDKKILVITGPNAGGKTVTLKTIGLLTALSNAGLPIPVNPSSSIPFVKSLYLDLYHEGSIEEHLSSFASHIVTLTEIVEKADYMSLILLDEIGTNTDPEEGSALACAILEELNERGSFTFVTTHLSKVKLYAASHEAMEIAAMLFDEHTMTPLYKLSIGNLRPSYALEVAKKYGFPERIIKKAYELKGTEDFRIYDLMNKLENLIKHYEEKLEELEQLKQALNNERKKLERALEEANLKKTKIIEESKKEAQKIINDIKKQVNFLYEQAKKADKKELKDISRKVYEITKQFTNQASQIQSEIRTGDIVKIRNLNLTGKVINIEDGRAKIQTDKMQIDTELSELEKYSLSDTTQSFIYYKPIKNNEESLMKKIDIRGMRVDEAISIVERFLNDLSINEVNEGLIIHGIGKGFLRDAVRQYLKDHPAVKDYRRGNPDEGGDSVTWVELK